MFLLPLARQKSRAMSRSYHPNPHLNPPAMFAACCAVTTL